MEQILNMVQKSIVEFLLIEKGKITMKYMEKPIDNLFNEAMTSNEARAVFFKALEGKSKEEIEQIKSAYSEVLHKITEREMRLAGEGWLID